MAKKYFIEYMETREKWKVFENDIMSYTTSFDKGVCVKKHCGFSRKKDAVTYANRLNKAAGFEIAKYWGSANV